MLKQIENFITRINTWISLFDWKDLIVGVFVNISSWAINKSIGALIIAITIIYFGWRIWQYYHPNNKSITSIEKNQNPEFIPLKDAILELNKTEDISSYVQFGKECGLTTDQYIADYHLMKYLEKYIFGNKITLQTISPDKTSINNDELPSPRTFTEGHTHSGNKWNNNYTDLCSPSGDILYTNLSIKKETMDKIKQRQLNEL